MNREQRLAQWIEGELDAFSNEELLRDLLADETFVREAMAQLQMKRLLSSQAVEEKEFTRELLLKVQSLSHLAQEPSTERALLKHLQRRRWWNRASLVAAGMAAAAVIAMLLFGRPDVVPMVRVLAAEGVQSLDVRALESSQQLTIEGGILEIALGAETRLVLEGPAKFAVVSVSEVRLISGRCYAEMDEGSSGLRIKTPSGEVLDLGTRFGVEVLPSQESSVHVFEGQVEVDVSQQRSILNKGEAAQWTTMGELTTISLEAERFVSRLPGSDQQHTRWLHWPFDERSGEVTDPQGEGFPDAMVPAHLHGARWIERDGSGALEFDGLDDWVETSFPGLGGDTDRTVAAWVKLAPNFGASHGQAIVGWGDFSILDPDRRRGAAWELGIGDTEVPVDTFGRLKIAVGGPLIVGHEDLRDGRWHHVAAVYLGNGAPNGCGVVLLYVDGRLQRRAFGKKRLVLDTDVQSRNSEPVQFGRQVMRATAKREYFKGAIDDIFLFNRALSGDEIRSLIQTNSAL
jgi:ferric-dicitrate binding protein FerR (iron transport regulator)